MKFSTTWLKDHLETDASLAQIVDTLNAIGLEVEGVEDPSEQLAGFTVAKVLSATKHPNADKLQVLTVDAGGDVNGGEPLQVVCGAPNARAGMVGVLGRPGAVVPSNGMELRKAAIRGVESNGMMCSVRELELGEEHDGIIELPGDAPVGHVFADYHGSSPVIDVAVTPNRPDCMGVYGIARDLAAAGLGTLKPIAVPDFEVSGACPVAIRTDDAKGCPAFYGRVVTGVKNGASPDWLQQRLKSAGQRPISLLVDLTNYLMLAYGRPAHVYDLAKLSGGMVARRAKQGEQVIALNDKTYTLDDTMMVIADERQVHDIAGIMGGLDSSVSETTTDVLLEIAYFDPASIGVTGRRLGLASDARTRFERGVDPEFMDEGLDLLTGLIVELADGIPSEAVRAGTSPTKAKTVRFDPGLTARLGGIDVPEPEQGRILEALEFKVADDWQVTCPPRRHDIEGPADLVEEIVRIHGLDKVESVALERPEGVARPVATPAQVLERKLRRAAAGAGLNEAITWSFIPVDQAEAVGGGHWSLDNPISEDMKVMRPSLLPGLLSATARSFDRGLSSVRLFEIGRTYLQDGEHPTLAAVLAGEAAPRSWREGKARAFDAYDAKAVCLALLGEAGVPTDRLQVMDGAGDAYHPGQSATLRLGAKNRLANLGMVHPSLLASFGIERPVGAFVIHLDAIPRRKPGKGPPSFAREGFAPLALQAVTRDFAFLVPDERPSDVLVRAIKGADKTNIAQVRVFDLFTGEGVPEGMKSLALEVVLQPREQSFKDIEIQVISDAIVEAAAKVGAALRS